MTIPAARRIAILCVALVITTVAAGVACAVVSDWRTATSTLEPTPTHPVPFLDHGQPRFATERAAAWHRRAWRACITLAAAAGASIVAAVVAAHRSDAIGRRWKP